MSQRRRHDARMIPADLLVALSPFVVMGVLYMMGR